VKFLEGDQVAQVSCGSRDAQTLCLTQSGKVYSWGDGDFGKLGRGGSDGCVVPKVIDRLTGQGIIKVGGFFALYCFQNVGFNAIIYKSTQLFLL